MSQTTATRRTRLVSIALGAVFAALLGKGGYLAVTGAAPERSASAGPVAAVASRADIVDRNGELLATTVEAWSLVADPRAIWDAGDTVSRLKAVLPDLDVETMTARLSNRDRKFAYIKRSMTPRQRQAVFDLGLEGLSFQQEPRRAYPRGTLAGHVLGYADIDGNGIAGIERSLDEVLKRGEAPVRLTLDNGVQSAVESELSTAAALHNIQGGAAILIDARNGEVRALASWPPINPNQARKLDSNDPARRNNAVSAVYELGSVFKPLTVAGALEAGAVSPADTYDVSQPLLIRGAVIDDDHPIQGGRANLTRIIAESSNIGTVKVNMLLGIARQEAFFDALGLYARAPVEMVGSASPIAERDVTDLKSATMSYGHGISVSPLAFLSAFASLANGGEKVVPTLVVDEDRRLKPQRVMSALTADLVVAMMREAVRDGTGGQADIAGYRVAGKTGTAEKPIAGGYSEDRNVTSFAAVFPADRPQYALIVTLDEPEADGDYGTTAAWNAAPTAGRIVERVAPLLGLAPRFEDVRPAATPQAVSVSYDRSEL